MRAGWSLPVVLACSCAQPRLESLEITVVREGGWSDVYESRLRMLHGQAVVARVRPVAGPGRQFAPYDFIELRGGDADVVELLPGLELDEHVFVGQAVGEVRLDALFDGEVQAELTVTVQTQRGEDD